MKKLLNILPTRAWHIIFCYAATFISLWLAIGLALGRESTNVTKFNDKTLLSDTINDLIADCIGIVLAILTLLL